MKDSGIPIHFVIHCLGFTNDRDPDRMKPFYKGGEPVWEMDPGTYFNFFNTRKLIVRYY